MKPIYVGRHPTFHRVLAIAIASLFGFLGSVSSDAASASTLAAAVSGGSTLELQVGGVAGVPSDAVAVVLNTTVTNPSASGFVTVFPCGEPVPLASNLNYTAGQTVPNLVLAKLGSGGKVCIYTSTATDVVGDVAGYFPASSGFTPIPNPQRILDTRTATPQPTLGVSWGPYQTGYGEVRPSEIYNGGDPTGIVSDISWRSWGDAQAIGDGTALYVAPDQIVADGHDEPAVVVAFDLGDCKGQLAYRAIEWYFPQHGEAFDPTTYINDCTGEYVY